MKPLILASKLLPDQIASHFTAKQIVGNLGVAMPPRKVPVDCGFSLMLIYVAFHYPTRPIRMVASQRKGVNEWSEVFK